jgi:hypothetical protein
LFFVEEEIKEISRGSSVLNHVAMVAEFYPDSDRLIVARRVKDQCASLELKAAIHLTTERIAGIKFVLKRWLLVRDFNDVSFGRWSKSRISTLYGSSIAVLDIEHHEQTGLTMRTLEALAGGNKLITTNQSIKDEPFFDENMILVIDRENPVLDKDFFLRPHIKLELEKYEIKRWLDVLVRS